MGNSYKPLLDNEVAEFREKCPDYTLGQVIFSMLTLATGGNFNKETLLTISDEELYKVARIAMKREIENPSIDELKSRVNLLGEFIKEGLNSEDLSNSGQIREWSEEMKEIQKKIK